MGFCYSLGFPLVAFHSSNSFICFSPKCIKTSSSSNFTESNLQTNLLFLPVFFLSTFILPNSISSNSSWVNSYSSYSSFYPSRSISKVFKVYFNIYSYILFIIAIEGPPLPPFLRRLPPFFRLPLPPPISPLNIFYIVAKSSNLLV